MAEVVRATAARNKQQRPEGCGAEWTFASQFFARSRAVVKKTCASIAALKGRKTNLECVDKSSLLDSEFRVQRRHKIFPHQIVKDHADRHADGRQRQHLVWNRKVQELCDA